MRWLSRQNPSQQQQQQQQRWRNQPPRRRQRAWAPRTTPQTKRRQTPPAWQSPSQSRRRARQRQRCCCRWLPQVDTAGSCCCCLRNRRQWKWQGMSVGGAGVAPTERQNSTHSSAVQRPPPAQNSGLASHSTGAPTLPAPTRCTQPSPLYTHLRATCRRRCQQVRIPRTRRPSRRGRAAAGCRRRDRRWGSGRQRRCRAGTGGLQGG